MERKFSRDPSPVDLAATDLNDPEVMSFQKEVGHSMEVMAMVLEAPANFRPIMKDLIDPTQQDKILEQIAMIDEHRFPNVSDFIVKITDILDFLRQHTTIHEALLDARADLDGMKENSSAKREQEVYIDEKNKELIKIPETIRLLMERAAEYEDILDFLNSQNTGNSLDRAA